MTEALIINTIAFLILIILLFFSYRSYNHTAFFKLKVERNILLEQMSTLKATTEKLIKDLSEYGVSNNTFHQRLLLDLSLTACLKILFDTMEDCVSEEDIHHIKQSKSKQEINDKSIEILQCSTKVLQIKEAFLNAEEPERFS